MRKNYSFVITKGIDGYYIAIFFLKNGSDLKRVKGSHHVILSKFNNHTFVIPVHSDAELDRGLLRGIIRLSGLAGHNPSYNSAFTLQGIA